MNPNFVIFTFINLISIVLSIYFFFRIFEVNFNNIIVSRSYSFIEPFLKAPLLSLRCSNPPLFTIRRPFILSSVFADVSFFKMPLIVLSS